MYVIREAWNAVRQGSRVVLFDAIIATATKWRSMKRTAKLLCLFQHLYDFYDVIQKERTPRVKSKKWDVLKYNKKT